MKAISYPLVQPPLSRRCSSSRPPSAAAAASVGLFRGAADTLSPGLGGIKVGPAGHPGRLCGAWAPQLCCLGPGSRAALRSFCPAAGLSLGRPGCLWKWSSLGALPKGWSRAWQLPLVKWRASFWPGRASALRPSLGTGFDPWKGGGGLGPAGRRSTTYQPTTVCPQAEAAAWIPLPAPGPCKRILLVPRDPRTAYLPPETLSCGLYETHPLKAWLKEAKDAADLGAIVRRKGYDFLFVHRVQWALLEPPDDPFYWDRGDSAAEARFKGWVQQLALSRGTPPAFSS